MKKEIISEISRIKNLFGYKKGVIISEQKKINEGAVDDKFKCINPEWIKTSVYDENGKSVELIQGVGDDTDKVGNKLSDISFDVNGNYYVRHSPTGKKFSCSSNNKIMLDGVEMTPAQNSSTVLATPKSLINNVGNKTGIQAFQDWLDANHSGWHKKYGTLGGDPKKGYGKFGPNTNAAYNNKAFRDEYLKTLTSTTPQG
jgi:hypothetical protein